MRTSTWDLGSNDVNFLEATWRVSFPRDSSCLPTLREAKSPATWGRSSAVWSGSEAGSSWKTECCTRTRQARTQLLPTPSPCLAGALVSWTRWDCQLFNPFSNCCLIFSSQRDLEAHEGISSANIFKLTHQGSPPLFFAADNENSAEKWRRALRDAVAFTWWPWRPPKRRFPIL